MGSCLMAHSYTYNLKTDDKIIYILCFHMYILNKITPQNVFNFVISFLFFNCSYTYKNHVISKVFYYVTTVLHILPKQVC